MTAIIPSAEPAKTRRPAGILAKLAARYDMDSRALQQTLVSTVFPGGQGSMEQVAALAIVAWEYELNPLLKQIYAFPEKGGGIIPIISVDGWYAIANRQPEFNGIQFEITEDSEGRPISCTATVWRKDRDHPVCITEYVSECRRNTGPWNQQPRRMIRHRAAIQAFRVAFGISAIDPDEAGRIPEYELQDVSNSPAKVHDVTLEDAKGRLGKAMKEEEKRAQKPAATVQQADSGGLDVEMGWGIVPEPAPAPSTMPSEPFTPPVEPQRKRRSRAVKDQRMEFSALVADKTVDTALISPFLPEEGDTAEQAFAHMWSDDAEGILHRCRNGEFTAEGLGGGQEHEPTFDGPSSDFPV